METLEVLQKTQRTIDQNHFERLQEILAPWKQNVRKLELVKYFCIEVITLKRNTFNLGFKTQFYAFIKYALDLPE